MPSELGSPNPLHDTSDTVTISVKARTEEIIFYRLLVSEKPEHN